MKKIFATLLFLFYMCVVPSAALAADTVPDNLLISLWPEYNSNQVFFMQQLKLPAAATLPATVSFAFPTGVQMQWTGEIMGADTSKDIAATPTVTQKDGYQEVTITLTKSHTAQAEAVWNGLKIDGDKRVISFTWTQRYESKTTTFEFLEPSKASNISMVPAPADTRQSADGFTYHLSAPKVMKVGQVEELSITYNRSVTTPSVDDATAAANPNQASGGAKEPVNNWVLLAIFVAAGAGIAAFVYHEKQKMDQTVPAAGKNKAAGKNTPANSQASKKPLIAIFIVVAVLSVFAVYSFSNTSSAPTGNNCEENVTYLQKGVDEYKAAWGKVPTSLKQLLEKKDGKGPFVETITLKCPTDGTYYTVDNGKVLQSESTEPPK